MKGNYKYFKGKNTHPPDWMELESDSAKHARGFGWYTFRKSLIKLRGEICECCKEATASNKLELHHIIKVRLARHLRFEQSNIIICCKKCHQMLEWIGEQTVQLSSVPATNDLEPKGKSLLSNTLPLATLQNPHEGEGPVSVCL